MRNATCARDGKRVSKATLFFIYINVTCIIEVFILFSHQSLLSSRR